MKSQVCFVFVAALYMATVHISGTGANNDTTSATLTTPATTTSTTTTPTTTNTTVLTTTSTTMATNSSSSTPTTASPSNSTTPTTPGNGTTDNATSAMPTIMTSMPATTPTPSNVGQWKVLGKDNKTCIMMTFQGMLQMKGRNASLTIPPSAMANSSKCSYAKGTSDFELSFYSGDLRKTIFVKLQFILQGDVNNMYMWNASVRAVNNTVGDEVSSQVQIRFETPVGMSYRCDQQTIPIGSGYNLTLSQMKLQPFAANASYSYGAAFSCVPRSGPSSATIVGLVLGAIIFLLVVVVVYQCKSKKSSARGPRYNQFS